VANFYLDNADLRFHIERALEWAPLVELTEDGYRAPGGFTSSAEAVDAYKETLTQIGQFVAERVAPVVPKLDHQPPRLVDGEVVQAPELDAIMREIQAMELHGLCLPRELGGINCPLIVSMIASELFARADVSVMAHHGFHGGMALAMLLYSFQEGSTVYDKNEHKITKTRFAEEIAEILRGEAWGSMDITEPNAGSDMAALSTKAVLEDGQWYVTGQKIFITSGHGKYHFVIARTEPAREGGLGLDGLSLFLAPAYRTRPDGTRERLATVDRLEDKLGHHSSATCAVSFDRTPGELIGQRGEGFKQMLLLMNGARVSVGFEALGLAEAALRLARNYAAERTSMGKTIDRHEMIADYLEEMDTDVRAIRALAVYAAFEEEISQRKSRALQIGVEPGSLESKRLERELAEHQRKSRRATPLLKYIASEKAVEISRRAIQIHGGAGYMVEYGAEKLLRDAMVMPIYEGTSQIQALMAMKDTLGGVMKNPQAFVTGMAQARWRSLSARDPLERRVAKIGLYAFTAVQHLLSRTATDKLKQVALEPIAEWKNKLTRNWDPKRDFAHAMLHAERLIKLLVDQQITEILWTQASRFPERRELLEKYVDRAEPRARFLYEEITTTGDRLIGQLADIAAEALKKRA